MANGLILGHISGKPSLWRGIKGLFDRRLPANRAVRRLLAACQRKQAKRIVKLTNAVHTAVFAPTGVGKGVSCIIPFLLTCRESCVIVDFKGENFNITADARSRMGHRVVRLDPFGVCGAGADTFNPLEFIDPDSITANDECSDLAEAMVIRSGQEKTPLARNG